MEFVCLGFGPAWPLLTIGLSALVLVAIVTFLMILINVILPKRRRGKCVSLNSTFYFKINSFQLHRLMTHN